MSTSTLSLGEASYDLLFPLLESDIDDLDEQGLGISIRGKNLLLRVDDDLSPLANLGLALGTSTSLNIKGDLIDFTADLSNNSDTINLNGNIFGVKINTDNVDSVFNSHDSLVVNGNITGSELQEISQLAMFNGNDTVRLLGEVDDTEILLGAGNDSLVISGLAQNLYVGGEGGRDFIEFRNRATEVVVQSGEGDDTVIFNSINGTSDASSVVELGDGNDLLLLNNGAFNVEVFTGNGSDKLKLSGDFDSTNFSLSGNSTSESSSDIVTVSAGSSFNNSLFRSENIYGDTLVVGYRSTLIDTDFVFGEGNDSVIFGSSSNFIDNYFDLGNGSDTLVFGKGSSFDNLSIDLGDDDTVDIIRFADDSVGDVDYVGDFVIVGASNDDILWIGAERYTFYDDEFINDNTFRSSWT